MGVDVEVFIKKESLERLLKKEFGFSEDARYLDEMDSMRWYALEKLFKLENGKNEYAGFELLGHLNRKELQDMKYRGMWWNILREYDLVFIADNVDSDRYEELEKDGYIQIIDIFDKIFYFVSDKLDEITKINLCTVDDPILL